MLETGKRLSSAIGYLEYVEFSKKTGHGYGMKRCIDREGESCDVESRSWSLITENMFFRWASVEYDGFRVSRDKVRQIITTIFFGAWQISAI